MIWTRFLLCASLSAAPAPRPIAVLFDEVEAVEKQKQNQDARRLRELDKKIQALGAEALRLGPKAVAGLAAVAQDPKRSDMTRLWAVTFLALTHDPSALAPVKAILYDPKAPELCRSVAASAVTNVDVSPAAQRAVLCRSLTLELPREALRAALFALSRLGCDDVSVLERRAKEFSGRPKGVDAPSVAFAVQALGRSFPAEAARALWRLFEFFPKGSAQRLQCLQALLAQRENQRLFEPVALNSAQDALVSESDAPENAVAAARLLASFDDPKAAPLLLRFLKNKDAAVVAECAEGLARLKAVEAKDSLQKVLEGVASDPRFAPSPGRPEPRELVARIQKSLESLKQNPK